MSLFTGLVFASELGLPPIGQLSLASHLILQFVIVQGESKTKLAASVKPLAGGGGIFKSAAVEVLRRERRLMTTGDITKYVLQP